MEFERKWRPLHTYYYYSQVSGVWACEEHKGDEPGEDDQWIQYEEDNGGCNTCAIQT